MPIYDFYCPQCQNEIEIIQKIEDSPPFCENCLPNQILMLKSISKSNFVLKGNGWYRDGYGLSNKAEPKK